MLNEEKFQLELRAQLSKWEDKKDSLLQELKVNDPTLTQDILTEIEKLEKYIKDGRSKLRDIENLTEDTLDDTLENCNSFWKEIKLNFDKKIRKITAKLL